MNNEKHGQGTNSAKMGADSPADNNPNATENLRQNVSKNLPKIAATEGNNHRLRTPRERIYFSKISNVWAWADILTEIF